MVAGASTHLLAPLCERQFLRGGVLAHCLLGFHVLMESAHTQCWPRTGSAFRHPGKTHSSFFLLHYKSFKYLFFVNISGGQLFPWAILCPGSLCLESYQQMECSRLCLRLQTLVKTHQTVQNRTEVIFMVVFITLWEELESIGRFHFIFKKSLKGIMLRLVLDGAPVSVCALEFLFVAVPASVNLSFFFPLVVTLILLWAPVQWAFWLLQGVLEVPLSFSVCSSISWQTFSTKLKLEAVRFLPL